MTEAEIRKFDKEVLVQVVKELGMFEPQNTMARLQQCRTRLRYRKLSERVAKLQEEMMYCSPTKEQGKWSSIYKKIQRIEKQMNKLLGAN